MGLFRPRRGTSAGARPEGPADAELLDRMRDGNETALEALYARYGALIYTLALRIVGDPELAREVLQDTFLRSWDGREAYDPERGRVPWTVIQVHGVGPWGVKYVNPEDDPSKRERGRRIRSSVRW